MAKKYCKYTKEQLQSYCKDESYCVKCVNGSMHIGLPPWGLKNFNETVRNIVSAEKLNQFDAKLNGIVLDIKSIKVVGEQYAVRDDGSALHINLNVKFYVFQPRIDAVLIGTVKHVALHHISVTIHRFFNVTIPLEEKNSTLKTNMSVMVKLTKFDFTDSIPYFEGELKEILWQDQKENSTHNGVDTTTNGSIKQEKITNGRIEDDSDSDSDSDVPEIKVKSEVTIGKKGKTTGDTEMMIKVKKEPTSSSESSSSTDSDEEPITAAKKSTNNTEKLRRASPLKKTPNGKAKHSSSDSSDESTSSDDGRNAKHRKIVTNTVNTINNGKRKHPSASSIIANALMKFETNGKENSESSFTSSPGSRLKKKIEDVPLTDSSFDSPGLSSTKISTKTDKKTTKSKDKTSEVFKKILSRFD